MARNGDSPPKPSPVACLACRRRHVKCDAVMPACTRCQTTFTECQYVRSKRGLRKNANEPPLDLIEGKNDSFDFQEVPDWLDTVGLSPGLDIDTTKESFQPFDPPIYDFAHSDDTIVPLPDTDTELVTPETAFDPMIQLYYHNFHHSHPMVIPRKALNSPVCYTIPSGILSVMRYIGAHYYPNPLLRQEYCQGAFSALSDSTIPDGFKVQALLLLAIIEHSHGNEKNTYRLIQKAISLALDIGMNSASFAKENSYGHKVLEESWRRTYWEIYIVDGLLAAMHQQRLFPLYHQSASLPLPCAESMYNNDRVTETGQTLQDLRNNWALGQNFTTFAKRISAVQKLGAVLELNRSLERPSDSQIETLDAQLTSSLIALPPLQDSGHDSSSHDEMVFQAQMILYLAIIHLHHPHSDMRFASFRITPPTSCTSTSLTTTGAFLSSSSHPHPHPQSQSQTLNLHSHKLLRAADLLSGLATLPSAIHRRSPFFTCALAMCIVVHTAALLVTSGSGKEESLKARIQLSIGGLKALGKVWPLAETVRGQMVGMYHEVVRR